MNIIKPDYLGKFYGDCFSEEIYKKLAENKFAPFVLAGERKYFLTKWFDYRRLHFLQATYYFIAVYNVFYKQWYKRTVNVERAPYALITKRDFVESTQRGDFMRCRRFCDRNGLPYDFFIINAIRHKVIDNDERLFFPRPSQICPSDRDEEEHYIRLWNYETKIRYAKDPFLKTPQWVGNPIQIGYENYIVKKIKQKRSAVDLILFNAIYTQQALRIERAFEEFDCSLVLDAMNLRRQQLKTQ